MFDRENENYIYEVVSKNMKRIRKEKGLTQAQVAERMSYSTQFISNIESKNHQTFSLGTLWRFAIVMDVDINELFIEDLIKLDLSLFDLTNKDDEKIYFIGGINNKGNKFSLSYTTEPPIELIDSFDELKDKDVCLNNIEDLDMVVNYINKLLNIVYNKEIKDMEDSDE